MKEKLERYSPYIRFFLLYTFLFFLISRWILFFLPFLISLTIAVVMKPVYDYLKRKFSFQPAFSATVITLFLFSVFLSLVSFLLFLIIRELIRLIRENADFFSSYLGNFTSFEKIYDTLLSGDMFPRVSGFAVSVVRIVPLAITFVIVSFVLTVYFLNHLSDLKIKILDRFHGNRREKLARILDNGYLTVRRFFRSYLILYVITFTEAVFIFYLTKTPYPLVFGLIAAVADLLPVLGPGAVYIPFAVINLIKGDWLTAVTLLGFYLITIVIRQIIEPKIVSDAVKLRPVLIFSAVYFSVVSMNFWILFYVIILALLYRIMKTSGVLFTDTSDEKLDPIEN